MGWLANLFTKHPEMGVYLAVGIGYAMGKLKFHGVGLGAVTGSLLGGILIGNFFNVPIADQTKSMLFLLFLFGIGYSVGPNFFRSLKGDGWRWAVLGVFVPLVGLLVTYAVAMLLRLDPGYAAGLLSGGLTESPAIGTASEAIKALPLSNEQKDLFVAHIAVADAICYIFGTLGIIWACSSLGPKLRGLICAEKARIWKRAWESCMKSAESNPRGKLLGADPIRFRKIPPSLERPSPRPSLSCLEHGCSWKEFAVMARFSRLTKQRWYKRVILWPF